MYIFWKKSLSNDPWSTDKGVMQDPIGYNFFAYLKCGDLYLIFHLLLSSYNQFISTIKNWKDRFQGSREEKDAKVSYFHFLSVSLTYLFQL